MFPSGDTRKNAIALAKNLKSPGGYESANSE